MIHDPDANATALPLVAAVEQAHDGIVITDVQGRIQYVNPSFCAMTGYSREEVVGQTLRILRSGAQTEEFYSDLWKTLLSGRVWRGEIVNRRKDGSLYTESMTATPVRDAGGQITHFIAIKQDISERRRSEEALLRSEARIRDILEHSTNVFYSHTPTHQLTYLSTQIRELLGYEPEEALVEWTRLATDNPVNALGYERTVLAIETGERQTPYELELRGKDGRLVWVEVHEAPVVRDGATVAIVGALTDITARKRAQQERDYLEEELRHAQKMEAVGRLAGGVAHDFNNLIGVILGYSELLLKLDPEYPQRGKVEQIQRAAEKAWNVTRQLLAFSRKQILDPRVLDVNAVVVELGHMLPSLVGEDVELELNLSPDLGQIKADPGQLEQVLVNLAANARDAMPRGGRLTIATANLEVGNGAGPPRSVEPGRYVCLTVSDTGVGMDTETQGRIFEPFFTTKEKGKGTGLGLATVYGIVKQSGGSIFVDSQPSEGTAFSLYFPRVDELVAPFQASRPPALLTGSETILVAEDEDPMRELVREVLGGRGYTILLARNGAEALETASQHRGPIDMLLTDVVMPGMNGRELADRLAAIRPGIKVLYMSGYPDRAIATRGILDPGAMLIGKPFSGETLAQRVRQVLG